MGLPIVRNLRAAGFQVTVFDLLEERSLEAGAPIARSAYALAVASDILITVLPGIHELEEALIGAGNLIDAIPAGGLWLDLTSNDPRVARAITDRATERGVDAVGAPMGGGVAAAQNGTLRFYIGGSASAVERARPVLDALGTSDLIGENVEAGYLAKLLANLLWFGQAIAVTEALLLGQAMGLSPALLRDQLASSAGGSVFIDEYLDRLLDGDYLETFGIDRCVEELETLVTLAETANVPFELSATITRLHREALQRFGAIDGELLAARLLEERGGTSLRRRP
jgi:3-hydroxyisobutyrate dehydrogenase-like beta-hydroxyacid dehydrogenase